MPREHELIAEQVKVGVEKLLAGQMDKNTFDEFIKTNNAKLDELAKKKRADEDWFRYSTTFC